MRLFRNWKLRIDEGGHPGSLEEAIESRPGTGEGPPPCSFSHLIYHDVMRVGLRRVHYEEK